MKFKLTKEQQEVVTFIEESKGKELVLIDSVAGSGKTTLLKAIADNVGNKKGLYLAYNKAIATSSSKKFPSNIACKTTHSLAYRATVKPLKLNVGFFGYRKINEKISYQDKYLLAEDIKEFCLSKYLTYAEYAKEHNRINTKLANKYLTLMGEGKIECTHEFYLKLFHIMLSNGDIEIGDYELLMLDEAGDLNEVTLEIFKLLPARIKVAVGDPYQNIYTFNHTINCFERLEDEGTTFKLSKSFRVPAHIAKRVEKYCRFYLNESMEFEGIESTQTKIKTKGYISRTNSGLIGKLIEMTKYGQLYRLVRPAKEIFKVPLIVANLKYQGTIYDPAYKHIQTGVDDWYENKDGVKVKYPTLFGYLKHTYKEDISIIQAISLISKYGKSEIFTAYSEALKHENKNHDTTLLTAHSSKGLEFDEVTLAPDMNYSIDMIGNRVGPGPYTDIALSVTDRETLNLYYVACTRALVQLNNAAHAP